MVGLAAALFALGAEHADHSFQQLTQQYPWASFIITPLGLMLIAWLTRRFFPGAGGSGIPQSIAALKLPNKDEVLSIRIAFGKILLTLLGLFSGASIGREGPTVHIGASIMYALGRFARFPAHYYQQSLIVAGGAAGVAAAFNTPLAGIVFALEEMSKSFESRTNGVILSAVIFAGLMAMALLGNYHYFGSSSASLPANAQAWLAIPVCGVIGGLLGGLFSQSLIMGGRKLSPFLTEFPFRTTFILGLVIASIGYVSTGDSYGTGYLQASKIMAGEEADLLFPLYKFGATLASYLTGIPGGIFAPSLATGAGIGYDLGQFLPLAPEQTMILLGMIAYFSAVVQAPITALVIILEMTANRDMILPLLITSFIANGTSKLICPQPIYQVLAQAFLYKNR